jgi:hypothetical protein
VRLPSALLALLLGLGFALQTFAVEPRRPGQESLLVRAVFAEGRLWLLSDAGELSSIAAGGDAREAAGLPEPVVDVCVRSGGVEAVSCEGEACQRWTLWRRLDGAWSAGPTRPARGESLVAMSCSREGVLLLTTRRLLGIAGAERSEQPLSEELPVGSVTAVHATAEQIFLGINRGEWGGGLRRIDRRSGRVTLIESRSGAGLCGGPLNVDCDPVNGIAAEPWKPDCVAAAIGLVHFGPHGRLVEVCGDNVRRLYFRPHGPQPARGGETGDEPFTTVAFFGLARIGDELWAAGIDGIYRMRASGEVQSTPLPRFQNIGGIGVSFELPQVVLVLTGVNQRRSLSGNVPMLVPR